ncbi:putative 5-methyltetrahydropteroyltriglutamate--homocysteine S-methyltransferase [Rosa chinensis]|uniref:Putative 5-methyltetrahydropteroyltriglutamate--homocysteine S-methyltransferase n=1 Tax=Rosa chinensis TaxID=74649 RepID=A0A2P6P4P2_ROSCH|nr:putative 5-methyltetrahydropteroyltriglutamate--homocysteine S-methyltransferase [Rosa chinensis]
MSQVNDQMVRYIPTSTHFIVPELGPDVKFLYASHKALKEYKEAKVFFLVQCPTCCCPKSKPAKGVEKTFSLKESTSLLDWLMDRSNIWANDLSTSLSTLQALEGIVGKDHLVVSTSCSLLHTLLILLMRLS